jgi:2-polyprenyl-6-methoxyphenol hydroxylase-like FAD-dependent oxidoreductase
VKITERKRPVLIVGGGPLGFPLAVELGWRGIACTLIEQGDGAIVSPKMNEVNIRTMEFLPPVGQAAASTHMLSWSASGTKCGCRDVRYSAALGDDLTTRSRRNPNCRNPSNARGTVLQ